LRNKHAYHREFSLPRGVADHPMLSPSTASVE
jgi:hypothetical protein